LLAVLGFCFIFVALETVVRLSVLPAVLVCIVTVLVSSPEAITIFGTGLIGLAGLTLLLGVELEASDSVRLRVTVL